MRILGVIILMMELISLILTIKSELRNHNISTASAKYQLAILLSRLKRVYSNLRGYDNGNESNSKVNNSDVNK